MSVSLTRLSWWWWGGKEKEPVSNGSSSMNPLQQDFGLDLKFKSVSGANLASTSTRKVKRKWKSREERKRFDKKYDVVLVPSDGVCLSGSESDDSDWSIGWLEPHALDFQNDDEADDSFAVLVPCYRHDCIREIEEEPNNQFLNAIENLSNEYSAESKKYMEQWLSSLQKF
ncbi:uncharacterized protein LOC132058981 [Lycium ferocissimum]|uniref:uncharacterized protein LOC132058981 n=1 Tax=Lycium ferocissimum TaxID=112874 RepID=UPI0028159914|nr:uncharacterized protein LOC132058981 [Lycium ferocissimum]